MKGNIELYSRYKFVIAIENSNCEDYVTEKLVHVVTSGSILIVAGLNNKPDYHKFLPSDFFINIYDYQNVDDLVQKLKFIANSKEEYEKYIKFKRHHYKRDELKDLSLQQIIDRSKTIINSTETFFTQLVAKETSENKLCKVDKFLNSHSKDKVAELINLNRSSRPSGSTVCLERKNLISLTQKNAAATINTSKNSVNNNFSLMTNNVCFVCRGGFRACAALDDWFSSRIPCI
jgi:hypothetical protein